MSQQGVVEAGEEQGGGREAGDRLVHDVTQVTVVATLGLLLVSTAATGDCSTCRMCPRCPWCWPGLRCSLGAQWPDPAPRHQWPPV